MSHQAVVSSDNRVHLSDSYLAAVRVTGADAVQFLQGQCTCDIKQLGEHESQYGAFCNAKGRVLTTFVVYKQAEAFWLLMPGELVALMHKHLSKYILRAKVSLLDCSQSHRLLAFGFNGQLAKPAAMGDAVITIDYPVSLGERHLLLCTTEQVTEALSLMQAVGYQLLDHAAWQLADIKAGIPWVTLPTMEAYIPQMLNVDQLGGISLSKGCYTGQEVVARTHYLGKSKRHLYLASAPLSQIPELNCPVLDGNNQMVVGHVFNAVLQASKCWLLLVLTDAALDTLVIQLDTETLTITLESDATTA